MADPNAAAGTVYASVTVSPDPGFELVFERLEAIEPLGRPFTLNLEVSSTKSTAGVMPLLGASVTIKFTRTDNTVRFFNGVVGRIVYGGLSGGAARYYLEVRPWIWLLSRTQDCRIFQATAPFDIITKLFRYNGFTDFVDKRQNQAGSTVLDYCVQYRETSLDFVTRLMEQFGIYYFFTHADGKHTLNFADDPGSHPSLPAAITYQRDMTEFRTVTDHIWGFSADLRLQAGVYTQTDYNFTTPRLDLTARSRNPPPHPHSDLEIYDYPGCHDTVANGEKLADIRNQEATARRQTFTGSTNARGLQIGSKFTLKDAVATGMNGDYLVIGTTSQFEAGESKSADAGELTDSYRCEFQAIPATTNFRLDRQTPVPLIRGPQTAKVVVQSGSEITTDQYGRVKIKFPWDRLGKNDDTASCWVRVAQSWAGLSWGSIFIPRKDQEVVVEFLEGNPDRPIITGCVYNADQTVPYSLPGNATRSTIKSNSSQGGNGFNELRFEDKAGSEEVFFQAQKDYTKKVLNNETVTITQDTTTTVQQGNRSVTVSQGNDTTTISTGNHSIKISAGASTVEAAQSITLKVGSNSITIDTTGVTISAAKISLQATGQLSGQGATVSFNSQGMMQVQAAGVMTLQGSEIAIN
jgi:type VI secretion system secreted protein VgrG